MSLLKYLFFRVDIRTCKHFVVVVGGGICAPKCVINILQKNCSRLKIKRLLLIIKLNEVLSASHFIISHRSLNRKGRWGTTDDFATSFLHFSLFSTALWDLPNSRPVHSLMLSSHLYLCLPCLLPLSLCLARWFSTDWMNERQGHTIAVCVSLQWSGGLHVV